MSKVKFAGFLVCLSFALFFNQFKASAQGINSGFREFGVSNSSTLTGSHLAASAGRATSIALHPTDANIALTCAEAGGLFYTTNGGDIWLNGGTDKLPFSGVGNAQIVVQNGIEYWFISTGGAFETVFCPTDGVWRSTNRGVNWEHIADFNDIPTEVERVVDPNEVPLTYYTENLLSPVLHRKQDYDSKLLQKDSKIHKIYSLPSNPSVMFICTSWGLWRTSNAFSNNVSWDPINTNASGFFQGFPYNLGRVIDIEELSINGSNSLLITTNHRLMTVGGTRHVVGPFICRSTDNGLNFSIISPDVIFTGTEFSSPVSTSSDYMYLNIEKINDRQSGDPYAFIAMQGQIGSGKYLRLGTLNENLSISFNTIDLPTASEAAFTGQYSVRSLFSFSVSPFSITHNSIKKYLATGGNG